VRRHDEADRTEGDLRQSRFPTSKRRMQKKNKRRLQVGRKYVFRLSVYLSVCIYGLFFCMSAFSLVCLSFLVRRLHENQSVCRIPNCLFVCLNGRLFVFLPIYLFVCLSISLFVCLSVCFVLGFV